MTTVQNKNLIIFILLLILCLETWIITHQVLASSLPIYDLIYAPEQTDSFVGFLGGIANAILKALWWMLVKIMVALIKIFSLIFLAIIEAGWSIARGILEDINLTQHISDLVSQLDSKVVTLMNHLRLFEFINNIISAALTRIVISVVPGM